MLKRETKTSWQQRSLRGMTQSHIKFIGL